MSDPQPPVRTPPVSSQLWLINFLTVLALSGSCLADPSTTVNSGSQRFQDIFHATSAAIPNRLIKAGTLQIGELSITGLVQRLPEVTWRTVRPEIILAGSGGQRTFAINFPAEKLVGLNLLMMGNVKDPKDFEVLCLHEGLEALGYLDENYELTLSLFLIAQSFEVPGPKLELKSLQQHFLHLQLQKGNRSYPNSQSGQGGGTSVGGGGDQVGIEVKMALIEMVQFRWSELIVKIPKFQSTCPEKVLELILNSAIEEEDHNVTPSGQEPDSLHADFLIINDVEVIRVPFVNWLSKPDLHDNVVLEILSHWSEKLQ